MGWNFDIRSFFADVVSKDSAAEPVSPTIESAADAYPIVNPLDLNGVKWVPSPNKSNRDGNEVRYIVLHHTGPGSHSGIVKWLCNPLAKASAHYVLGKRGELTQIVSTKREAWHAGRSKLNGVRIDNRHSIGIEICNKGVLDLEEDGNFYYEFGRNTKKYNGQTEPVYGEITYPDGSVLGGYYVPYPEKQLRKLVALCKALVEKYPAITRENILTHYEIGFPKGRKNDPFGLNVEEIKTRVFGV